jgi:hypothetical protein
MMFLCQLGNGIFTQNPTIMEDLKPSTLKLPGEEYPMVSPQGYARFQIEPLKAKVSG